MNSNNIIGKIIFNIGIGVIVLGVIGSFILAGQNPAQAFVTEIKAPYNITFALQGALSCSVCGVLLIGFAEVIRLIQNISDKADVSTVAIDRMLNSTALKAGTYIVGVDILPGKYTIYGTGDVSISASLTSSPKTFKIATTPNYAVGLEKGNKVTFTEDVRLTVRN